MPTQFSPEVLEEARRRGVHPGAVEFERLQARSRAYQNARTPEEFAALLRADTNQTDSMRALLGAYEANPGQYEIRGGQLVEKKNPFAQFFVNNPWVAPAALIGGAWAGAGFPGFGAGASAAGGGSAAGTPAGSAFGTGAGATRAATAALPFAGGATAIPGAIPPVGGPPPGTTWPVPPEAIPGAGGTALDALIGGDDGGGAASSVGGWLRDNWRDLTGLGLASAGALRGSREPESADALNRILGLAEGRVNATNPLFEQLVNMAGAQLPRYTRETE